MRTSRNTLIAPILAVLLLIAMLAVPAVGVAAEPTVDLGTSSSFGVLAGQTITNTGATTVGGSAGGDIGLYPGTSFPGMAQVTRSGAVHLADEVAKNAKADLVAAYDDAAGRTPTTIPSQLDGQQLSPGVYNSSDGTFNLAVNGTLTLDGEGVYIFQTATTLVMESGSTVSLINGAVPCRVFWKVGSSATLGTDSRFVGHVFALTSISAQTGAIVRGQLLARNGSVTLDHNTISNSLCVNGPALHIAKKATPAALKSGAGTVTFTYLVSNPGTEDLTNVLVTDDKLSNVSYVSGDVNDDKLLQPGEVWVYTAKAKLGSTTTNTATANADTLPGIPVSDTARTTVRVSTVSGGKLPNTATPWYNLLLVGVALTLVGAAGWWRASRKIRA